MKFLQEGYAADFLDSLTGMRLAEDDDDSCAPPGYGAAARSLEFVLVASSSCDHPCRFGLESASWDPWSEASAAAQQVGPRRGNQHFARGCSGNVAGRLSGLQLRTCRGGCPCLTN